MVVAMILVFGRRLQFTTHRCKVSSCLILEEFKSPALSKKIVARGSELEPEPLHSEVPAGFTSYTGTFLG
jgi:hypothetical protein